jgi:hypothetical protein
MCQKYNQAVVQQILSIYLILDRIIGLLNCSIIVYFLIKSSSSWLRDQIIISTGPIYIFRPHSITTRFTKPSRQIFFDHVCLPKNNLKSNPTLFFWSNSNYQSILFSSPCQRQCELLPSLCVRRLSSVNPSTKWSET